MSELSGSSDSVSPAPTPPKKRKISEKEEKRYTLNMMKHRLQTEEMRTVEENQPVNVVTITDHNPTIESMPVIIEASKQDCTSCKVVEGVIIIF